MHFFEQVSVGLLMSLIKALYTFTWPIATTYILKLTIERSYQTFSYNLSLKEISHKFPVKKEKRPQARYIVII